MLIKSAKKKCFLHAIYVSQTYINGQVRTACFYQSYLYENLYLPAILTV